MNGLKDQLRIFGSSFSIKKRRELFAEIWQEYYPRLRVYLEISFGTDDAEDLVQEIMLKVFNKLESYNPVYSFNTWIYSIARNHAIDRIRSRETAAKTLSVLEHTEAAKPIHENSTPEYSLIRKELKNDIAEFLDNLPEPEKQISFLRHYEELSHREISRITDIPVGTIKSHLYNIRKKLGNYYGENYAD